MAEEKSNPKEGFEVVNSVDNAEKFNAKPSEKDAKKEDTLDFFERRWFREWLVYIKKKTNLETRKFYQLNGIIVVALLTLSIIVDMFAPIAGWWTILRTVILLVMTFFGFNIAYGMALFLNSYMTRTRENWTPFRSRHSPKWRIYYSIMVAAVIIVLANAFGDFVGYTAFSTAIVITGLGLLAFMRKTRAEQRRAQYGIPDPRDVLFEQRVEEQQREREEQRERQFESDEDINEDDDERFMQSDRDMKKAKKD